METNDYRKVLFIGIEQSLFRAFSETITSCGVSVEIAPRVEMGPSLIKDGCFDIVVVDLDTLRKAEFSLTDGSLGNGSRSKIIALTSIGEKEDIPASLGVFDYIEKPICPNTLLSRVKLALDLVRKEQVIVEITEKLDRQRDEVAVQRVQLEALQSKLSETYTAVSILGSSVISEREQVEKQVALKLSSIVIPAVDKLRRIKVLEPYLSELNQIVSMIGDVTSGLTVDARIAATLTTAEFRIASLIRSGLSTDEIVHMLHISPKTVWSHRKKIRKKLKIDKTSYSLNNFLLSRINDVNEAS